MKISCKIILAGLCATLLSGSLAASDDGLSGQIQNLKQGVLDLNRDLSLLERELLYPSSESAVFVSVDVGTPIRLVDVNLTMDGKHVGYHFYSEQEFTALTNGGIHRIFHGNLASGRHTLEATVTGYDPQGKDYQKTTTHTFTKGPGRKMLELRVVDDLSTMQHRFEFREWNE
ncbi:hypothetical protein [Alcanivorax sp. 1008]|uniref:hypothetical protein n=1 Tax=Alcanivorax sp. 1008 TaxID=2816853 RepID=UPI001D97FB6A|nr:hypothetical protein [Alcanivorax sp. 1008]MCC1497138.1 hypothetical protein [Alcanivorax sp. 1008]